MWQYVPVKQIIPCFDTLSKKTENDVNNIKKLHSFVGKKAKNHLKKSNDLEKLHPDFSEERKKGKAYYANRYFLPKSGIYLRIF